LWIFVKVEDRCLLIPTRGYNLFLDEQVTVQSDYELRMVVKPVHLRALSLVSVPHNRAHIIRDADQCVRVVGRKLDLISLLVYARAESSTAHPKSLASPRS